MIIASNIFLLGISHALIDATCAAGLFFLLKQGNMAQEDFFILVVIYNILAFGLQAPLGILADKWQIPVRFAIAGCISVALSTIFVNLSAYLTVFLAGVGNALFHVGGGVIALNLDPKKASLPGIFVAPGALGLLIGAFIGKELNFVAWPFVILLFISAILMYFIKKPLIDYSQKMKKTVSNIELAILLILLSIVIRSIIGLAIVFPWKQNFGLLVILTLAVFLGKGLGGIIGDKFGWMRVSVVSLLLSASLLFFGVSYPICGIAGFFLFNMTMPITLVAISNMLPGRPGFAFGLTTLALLFGAILTFTELKSFFSGQWVIITVILISIFVLYRGLKLYFLNEENI
jgi:MFS transporter, FSR family, fosmidomycin resistance protein